MGFTTPSRTTFTGFSDTSADLATAITDESGSGALVFNNTPTLVTPTLGVASATSINKVTITQPATGATLTIPEGVTLNAGAGGTLGSNAFTSTAYAPLASPSLTTPSLGVATATSINKVAITAPVTSATLTIADGKTLLYDSGTWTPVRNGFTEVIGAGSITNVGTWTKIGNMIHVKCTITPADGATITGAAGAYLSGLPVNGGAMAGTGRLERADAVTSSSVLIDTTNMIVTTAFAGTNTTVIVLDAWHEIP